MKCDIMKLMTFFFLFPGNALVKTGQTQTNIGNAEKEFVQSTANNFLQPLRNFLEGDMKTIQVLYRFMKLTIPVEIYNTVYRY